MELKLGCHASKPTPILLTYVTELLKFKLWRFIAESLWVLCRGFRSLHQNSKLAPCALFMAFFKIDRYGMLDTKPDQKFIAEFSNLSINTTLSKMNQNPKIRV